MPDQPPLISVIIPVFDVGPYLDRCLDSVLGQPFADIEVIAVEGGSSDGSGALLDAREHADPRLRVLRRGRTDPGPARNAGLACAAGSYVWFVDADDLVAPGSLQAVADAVRRDHPDLLLIDFESLYPDGRTEPSPGRQVLRSAPAGCFRLADWPAAIGLTATAWSRVFRREFLLGLDPFPPGPHEDVPVTFSALLTAGRISVLSRVCYRYRRERPGSYMAESTDRHFAIFRSYRRILDLADSRAPGGAAGIPASVRAALFSRAIWHYVTVLDGAGGGRVPRDSRRRYFAMMHGDYLGYRPAGYRRPGGLRGVRYLLIERNAYRAYAALRPVNGLRVQIQRAVRR